MYVRVINYMLFVERLHLQKSYTYNCFSVNTFIFMIYVIMHKILNNSKIYINLLI